MLILINLFKAYWKPLLAVLILGAIYLHEHGLYSDIARLNAIIEQSKVVAKAQEEHNKIVMQEQAKVTSDIILDRDKSLKSLKDYYETRNHIIAVIPKRMYDSPANSREVSSIPNATIKLNAIPESTGASPEESTTITVGDCAEDVLNLLSLQKWIKEQYQLTNQGN